MKTPPTTNRQPLPVELLISEDQRREAEAKHVLDPLDQIENETREDKP